MFSILLGFFFVMHRQPKLYCLEVNLVNKPTVSIGNRTELFVDEWLIERKSGVTHQMSAPIKREVVLVTDKAWEGVDSAYYSVIQDGKNIRLYYRGFCPEDASEKQVTCMAESTDGVHFSRPNLGMYSFNGSSQNNIVHRGVESHNFAPFLDSNPNSPSDQRYKALAGINGKLYAFRSPDGIHWAKMQEQPVITKGAFDSLNLGFWDEEVGLYRCYSRYYGDDVRAIQSCTSRDFIHWSVPVPNIYAAGIPKEHFYTSSTTPCPGAPHILLAFPKRFQPERTKLSGYKERGISDAMFMSSRDGVNWDRTFLEAWVRPDLDMHNWTQRSNMPATGIVQTDPYELSMYISEHYEWPDNRLRRLTMRPNGFAAVHCGVQGGEFTTRSLIFTGKNLYLNYATSTAGSIQVELQDSSGKPIPGYSMADMSPLFGNELDASILWKKGGNLSAYIGKPVRFRFYLKDADLYSLRTGEPLKTNSY